MDGKRLEEKLNKLRSSMDEIPSRTDKSAILQEVSHNKRKNESNNIWLYAGSIASVLILSLLLFQSWGLHWNKADEESLLLPGKDEEVLELGIGLVEISTKQFREGFVSKNDVIRYNDILDDTHPTFLRYDIALANLWDEPLGSIRGFDPEKNSYENGVQIHIEPRETFLDVMSEVIGYNVFEQPSSLQGHPVISTINGNWYTISYELGSDIESTATKPLPTVTDMDRLLDYATEVDVVVTLKDKEIGRFYLKEEMNQVNKVPMEERIAINYNLDNMDRGNHDFISDVHGDIVIDLTYEDMKIQRGDIIYYQTPSVENKNYNAPDVSIARIVGLPGEKVSIKDGYVYINGERLDRSYNKALVRGLNKEKYIKTMDKRNYDEEGMEDYFNQTMEQVEVPQNSVFVLGDQWWRSVDSRMFGPLLIEHIEGRVMGYKE